MSLVSEDQSLWVDCDCGHMTRPVLVRVQVPAGCALRLAASRPPTPPGALQTCWEHRLRTEVPLRLQRLLQMQESSSAGKNFISRLLEGPPQDSLIPCGTGSRGPVGTLASCPGGLDPLSQPHSSKLCSHILWG